jgi:hypothetical protein
MYRGALNVILSNFDSTLCMIFVLDGLTQPQSCTPEDQMDLRIALYRSSLFSVVRLEKTKDYEPNTKKYTLNLICSSSFSQIQLSFVVPKM